MSACLQLREPGIARVRRWCLQRVSRACPVGGVRRLPAAAGGRRVPAAPGAGALAASGRGSRSPGSATPGGTRDWVLCWRDRHLCVACMTSLSHHRASATCCARLTGLIAIFWGQGRPGWGVRTVPVPDCAVAGQGLPGTLFPRSWTVPGSHELRQIIPGTRRPWPRRSGSGWPGY